MSDAAAIEAFVRTLFAHAADAPGSYASLRVFHQFDRSIPPLHVEGVRADDLAQLARRAAVVAERAARLSEPSVFAVPLCTFCRPDKARAEDLALGLAISVEADAAPARARTILEHLLGPCTCIVESGSVWADPETGGVQPCAHLHWKLREPAADPAAHLLLNQARRWAALRVQADLSGAPTNHPFRWPSLNRKHDPPREARICSLRPEVEIDLEDAAEKLRIEASPLADAAPVSSSVLGQAAEVQRVAEALAATPNVASYDEWIRVGYALCGTLGSELGLVLFAAWSARNEKFNLGNTRDVWKRIVEAGPRNIGAGTIFYLRGQQQRQG